MNLGESDVGSVEDWAVAGNNVVTSTGQTASIFDTTAITNLLQSAVTAWGSYKTQQALIDINTQRVANGLAPITATQAGLGLGVTAGLDSNTRTLLWVVGGGAALALLYMAFKRRG